MRVKSNQEFNKIFHSHVKTNKRKESDAEQKAYDHLSHSFYGKMRVKSSLQINKNNKKYKQKIEIECNVWTANKRAETA